MTFQPANELEGFSAEITVTFMGNVFPATSSGLKLNLVVPTRNPLGSFEYLDKNEIYSDELENFSVDIFIVGLVFEKLRRNVRHFTSTKPINNRERPHTRPMFLFEHKLLSFQGLICSEAQSLGFCFIQCHVSNSNNAGMVGCMKKIARICPELLYMRLFEIF